MSRDKLPDFAFLSQNAVFPAMVPQQALCFAVVPQLYLSSVLAPDPLKCMMAQRCLIVQPYAIQILSNVPR